MAPKNPELIILDDELRLICVKVCEASFCHGSVEMPRKPAAIPSRIQILIALVLFCCAQTFGAAPRALVYQKNGKGFVHDNLAASAAAIRELGAQNGFEVEVSTNAAIFSDATLKQFGVLIFANSNNEAFETEEQRAAFEYFIKRGGGFVGIHSSTGSERNWSYFQQVQGAKFFRHSPLQRFTINVLDSKDPATAHLHRTLDWTDECYFFTNINPNIHILLAAEISSLKDPKLKTAPGQMLNGIFPLAWRIESGGGRHFYTSLGHRIEHYSDPIFRQHLLGGIQWALGKTNIPSKFKP